MGGVIRTRTKEDPTYHQLGDHTETLQIDYDPARISYERLLEIFWASHDPEIQSRSSQYKPAVFYHNEEQKKMALKTKDRLATRIGKTIRTEILPLSQFYPAEGYHQKYRLRKDPEILQEFRRYYPGDDGFIRSTAASRVNGYLAGYGTLERFEAERTSLGLSEKANRKLYRILQSKGRF